MSRRQAVRCSARSTRSGEQCRAWAVDGATVCVAHGGRAPQVRAAAKRRVAEGKAVSMLARRSREPVGSPTECAVRATDGVLRCALAGLDLSSAELAEVAELDAELLQADAMVARAVAGIEAMRGTHTSPRVPVRAGHSVTDHNPITAGPGRMPARSGGDTV